METIVLFCEVRLFDCILSGCERFQRISKSWSFQVLIQLSATLVKRIFYKHFSLNCFVDFWRSVFFVLLLSPVHWIGLVKCSVPVGYSSVGCRHSWSADASLAAPSPQWWAREFVAENPFTRSIPPTFPYFTIIRGGYLYPLSYLKLESTPG